MANFLNLFTAYRNMENQDRADATNNYLNKVSGNPQGVDAAAVQVHRANDITNNTNQNALEQAQLGQHLANMSTFLDTLGNADAQAQQAVGPAPVDPGDNATPEQRQQYEAASHQYQQTLGQAQQQARAQAWQAASRLAPQLGIDPGHIDAMQQDYLQHGTQFVRDVHGAIQARLTPNSGEIIGSPGDVQDANGNVVVVTRGGQTRTLEGLAPTSSVNSDARIAASRDIAASNDQVQREGIDERRQAAVLAHPNTQTSGAAIAAPILESNVPAATANIDRAINIITNSALFHSDNVATRAARVAEYQLPTSQLRTNIEGLKHQLALIDLRAMRQSGFSLGRVTNTEFAAASSGLANLDPNLNAAQLQSELGRIRLHLQRFQAALTADLQNPANANITPVPDPNAAAAPGAGNAPPPAPASGNTLSPDAQALLNGF